MSRLRFTLSRRANVTRSERALPTKAPSHSLHCWGGLPGFVVCKNCGKPPGESARCESPRRSA